MAIDEVMQEVCRQKNIVKQFLEVRVSNEPAIALYQKYGFVAIGRRKEYYINPVEDAILMKKRKRNVRYLFVGNGRNDAPAPTDG